MDTLSTEPAPSCHSLGTSMLLLALLEWSSPEDWPMGEQQSPAVVGGAFSH